MNHWKGRLLKTLRTSLALSIFVSTLLTTFGLTSGASRAYADSPDIGLSFGVNGHIATRYGIFKQLSHPMGMLAGTGVRWDREEFRWDMVEPSQGRYDWGFTDEMVGEARARGINVLGLLDYSVGWATPGSGSGSNQPAWQMPNLDAWSNYVFEVVNRYKGSVESWEIWNEENHPVFWQPNPDPGAYTQLLRAAYQSVKRADPSARVVLGGVSGVDVSFLESVTQNGGWDYFDVLAIHPYTAPKSPESGGLVQSDLAKAQAFVERHGGGKPIWITEIGYPSSNGPWGVGSEETQADYLVRTMIQVATTPGVERIFWYDLRNDGNNYGQDEYNYGLLQSDWATPKKAYWALQSLTSRLDGATFEAPFDLNASRRTLIDDFEGSEQWHPWGSGASGNLERSADFARSGSFSGKLGYSFWAGGKDYLDVSLEKPLSGQPTKVGLSLYGDRSGHILWLTFLDATGERFMVKLGNIGPGWQTKDAYLSNYFSHEGGNNDGRIDYPVRFNSLIIDNDPDGTTGSGSIYVDNLYSEEGSDFFGYRFKKGDDNVDVLWTDGPGEVVRLPTASSVATVFDMYGGSQSVQASDGALWLSVSDHPIYVEHQGSQLKIYAPQPSGPSGFSDASFRSVWERTDSPQVNQGTRSWYWGPVPWQQRQESYASAPAGSRLVQYFDKSRMEINNPNGDRNSLWFVTNGLLVKEMISGRLQVGDGVGDVEVRQPADIPVVGDPTNSNPDAPTYASLQSLASLANDRRAQPRLGQDVTEWLDKFGNVGSNPSLGGFTGTNIAYYDQDLGHNIPDVFWSFLNRGGGVYRNGAVVKETLVNWVFLTGLPITEPYWVKARVGGVEKDVLVQAFERRVLTYTPGNPAGWEVEMGNVGQHYFSWRYPAEGQPWLGH